MDRERYIPDKLPSNGSALHDWSRASERDAAAKLSGLDKQEASRHQRGLTSSVQRLRAMRHQAHLDSQVRTTSKSGHRASSSDEDTPRPPSSGPPISTSASFPVYSKQYSDEVEGGHIPSFAKKPDMATAPSSQSTARGAPAPAARPPTSTRSSISGASGAAAQSSAARGRNKEVEGYVGFANLPNQVYRRSVKNGFDFTLMVVGASGLGKSTLINSLFLTDIYSADYPGPSHRPKKTLKVDTTRVLLREGGVQLRLTVVDTPGFGDAVDNTDCWQPVIEYIERRYEEHLAAESKVQRTPLPPDGRVHCCLYFIAPTGHGLKTLDVEFMKRLHEKVNIIPIISKADTLTPDEVRDFKKTITNEIAQHKIKVYTFPEVSVEDESSSTEKALRERVPFAVVGSNYVLDVGGNRLRGRQYPWGVVEVENLAHNDFVALRNMVVRTHMQDLVDVTNNVHYENFRYRKLAPDGASSDGKPAAKDMQRDPLTQMEEERRAHEEKLRRMELEMEQVFEAKVKEKMQKLRESETDLEKRTEQMQKSLEHSRRELEERKLQFERERAAAGEDNRLGTGQRSIDSRDSASSEKSKLRRGHSFHGGDKHKKEKQKKSLFHHS